MHVLASAIAAQPEQHVWGAVQRANAVTVPSADDARMQAPVGRAGAGVMGLIAMQRGDGPPSKTDR